MHNYQSLRIILEEFKLHLKSVTFLENTSLNIAVEQDNKSFLKLKSKG